MVNVTNTDWPVSNIYIYIYIQNAILLERYGQRSIVYVMSCQIPTTQRHGVDSINNVCHMKYAYNKSGFKTYYTAEIPTSLWRYIEGGIWDGT